MYTERRAKLFAFMSKNMLDDCEKDESASPEFIEEMESQNKIYEFLATCSETDIEWLFRSGAFADQCEKYCDIAMEKSGINQSKRQEVSKKLQITLSNLY